MGRAKKCGWCANCVRVGGKKRKCLQLAQQAAAPVAHLKPLTPRSRDNLVPYSPGETRQTSRQNRTVPRQQSSLEWRLARDEQAAAARHEEQKEAVQADYLKWAAQKLHQTHQPSEGSASRSSQCGRPKAADLGSETRNQLEAVSRTRNASARKELYGDMQETDTQGKVSKPWITAHARRLEDTLFSIGGITLTAEALAKFLERPAVRPMMAEIMSSKALTG